MHVERFSTENTIVTVTTREEPRYIDYADIFAAVTIEPDEWAYEYEFPWEYCEGYSHDVRGANYYDHSDMLDNANHVGRWNRSAHVVELDRDAEKSLESGYLWYRAEGASKQVAAELVAQRRQDTLEQLLDWLENGWDYWRVSGEYKGRATDSCGSIDCYDYAEDEVKSEVADELVAQLEADGFIITDKPVEADKAALCRANRRASIAARVNMFNRR